MREFTQAGIEAAIPALNRVIRDGRVLGDEAALERHLADLERDGVTEVDSSRTVSRRPELVYADPSWFA